MADSIVINTSDMPKLIKRLLKQKRRQDRNRSAELKKEIEQIVTKRKQTRLK